MVFLRIAVFVLLLLPGLACGAELGSARISLITGDVQIYTADTQDWVPAAVNTPLMEGDRLWVPEGSRTEIQIQGGVYVRLGSATSFDILALQEESFQFYLNGGHAYINNRKGGIDHIQVDTPQSSVGCYDNSLVMIDVDRSGATDVSVLKGYASAETASGRTGVDAGNTLHIGSDMTAEVFPLAPPDEWENWNRDRDRQLVAGNRSLRYIPEELDDYAYDLDDYGQWVYLTDYGYCWRPLAVPSNWSPYRVGRWCWMRGDYVWVSYEPWGWAPYHYGRWTFVARFGWCWVPPRPGAVYWGPGYVGWVSTPTYVAWVPLAPGETYYGRRYYGPGSVNITNVTINRTVVQNFRNVNVRNAVTVVNTTTFVSGRKEPVRVSGNPFRAANVAVGPPAIKPSRATAIPVIRNIPAARKPPERVRRVSVDQIKRERSLVREQGGSAFRPGKPDGEMPVRKRSEPQGMIREEHPALPAAKPGKGGRLAPGTRSLPAARQPEVIRGPQAPPAAKPATPRKSRQPSRPVQPSPPGQAAPAGRGEAPAKIKQEPRWQEPRPAAKPGTQRQQGAPQPRGEAPQRRPPKTPPQAGHKGAPAAQGGERPPEAVPGRMKKE